MDTQEKILKFILSATGGRAQKVTSRSGEFLFQESGFAGAQLNAVG